MPRPQQPEAVREAIVTMYLDGLTVRQIVAVAKVRVPIVDHVLLEAGLTRADRGKRLMEFWTEQYAKINV